MIFDPLSHTILASITGSQAYGLATEASDIDIKGVLVAPWNHYLGFMHRIEQVEDGPLIRTFIPHLLQQEIETAFNNGIEGVIYDIQKFMNLAVQANPNILDVLFCRDQDVFWTSNVGDILLQNRELFLTAKAKHTFSGYAYSQLKRIKLHLHSNLEQPKRSDFGLPESTRLVPKEQMDVAEATIRSQVDRWNLNLDEFEPATQIQLKEQISRSLAEMKIGSEEKWWAAARTVGLDENLIHLMGLERQYQAAMGEWQRYLTWKRERNPERAALEAKYGYDCKHAMHLVRLMRAAKEILLDGRYNVWRGDIDAEELKSIRNGAWSYEQILEWAEQQDHELTEIYNSKRYIVPHAPDKERLDKLCISIIENYYYND